MSEYKTLIHERSPGHKSVSDVIKIPDFIQYRGSIGYLEKILIADLVFSIHPKLIIETGTRFGCTTRFLAMLIELNALSDCSIVSFDHPEVIEELERRDLYFVNHPHIKLIKGALPGSLKSFLESTDRSIDFAIIDARHSYEAVLSELELIHPRIKDEGYLFCHDYRRQDVEYEGVVRAVDEFVERYQYHMLPVTSSDDKRLWGSAILRKQALVK